MKISVGERWLITTDGWFYGPDGKEYRGVWGTVHAVLNDADTLGIKTNVRSTNWYVRIGSMVVAGCQIHYAIRSDVAPPDEAEGWWTHEDGIVRATKPSVIFNADA